VEGVQHAAGDVCIADTANGAIKELPNAFVNPTVKLESFAAGSDALPVVLPATANLLPPCAPASDQSWLTFSGASNGMVAFSFLANTGSRRTANISLLGHAIPVRQAAPFSLGVSALLVEPSAGTNSVVLAVSPGAGTWMDAANASRLHLSQANQQGTGSTNVVFTYDANLGATRSNTLTIAAQTLTVTQAGSTYVAAQPVTTLVPSANYPQGVAVDASGNLYIADTGHNALKKWTAANNTVTTLVPSGLNQPDSVAVDGAGNVYIASEGNHAILKWTAANGLLSTLLSSGVSSPYGVAVDRTGNVYVADFGNHTIREMPCAFVAATPKLENLPAGNDALPPVLPVTANLLTPFSPASDQLWLTINGTANGVVSFSCTADTGSSRTANVTLLGHNIPVTQEVTCLPPILTGVQALGGGTCQFCCTNSVGASFTVLSATNLSLPISAWTVVGTASNTAPGLYQFTTQATPNDPVRFCSVRAP